MSQRLILGNIIGGDGNTSVPVGAVVLTNGGSGYSAAASVDFVGGGGEGAAATTTEGGSVITGITLTAGGTQYYQTPAVNLVSNTGTGATAIAQLSSVPTAQSSDTFYHDRLQWSAPNAYGFFDPNFGTAPGGFDTLTEARGVVSGLAVVEGALFAGHSGGQTETTPNASSSLTPFSFFPLWSADQTVLVRYGSLAQYGSTTCFLGNDTAYMLSPNGLTPIGTNIGNLLQDAGIWNNGSYPLQGLYGSIVEIEGELHYLIALSSDDYDFTQGNASRFTTVFDYNIAENNWMAWGYTGLTVTCPIYQSIDTAIYPALSAQGNEIAKDNWLLMASTSQAMPAPITGPQFEMIFHSESGNVPFGYVIAGQSLNLTLFIVNQGTTTLTISGIAVGGANSSDFAIVGTTSFSVAPGAVYNGLSVTFTPTAPHGMAETATIFFTDNDGGHGFTMTGTVAAQGSMTGPFFPTPTGATAGVSATPNEGVQSFTGASANMPAQSLAGGTVVSVAVTYNATFGLSVFPPGGGSGNISFQSSDDGGTTWISFQDYSATATTNFPSTTSYLTFTVLNLNLVKFRVVVTAQAFGFPPSGTASSFGDITMMEANVVSPGDVFVQITQLNSGKVTVPVAQWGIQNPGTPETFLGVFSLSNPTLQPISISITPDSAAGYSIVNASGSLTLGPSNANSYTFQLQLNPSAGPHDDTTAVSITAAGQVGPLSIESWYSTAASEQAIIQEIAPVNRALQLLALEQTMTQMDGYIQFRTETPSIGRQQSERRWLFEYENLENYPPGFFGGQNFTQFNFTLNGQQDPVPSTNGSGQEQTLAALNTALTKTYIVNYNFNAPVPIRSIFTGQIDFGTFSGVCLQLIMQTSNQPFSLVRFTRVTELMKAMVP
jgi:hypothetical protein